MGWGTQDEWMGKSETLFKNIEPSGVDLLELKVQSQTVAQRTCDSFPSPDRLPWNPVITLAPESISGIYTKGTETEAEIYMSICI